MVTGTSGLPDDEQGLATGLTSMTQQIGITIGIPVLSAVAALHSGQMGGIRLALVVNVVVTLASVVLVGRGLRRKVRPMRQDRRDPSTAAPEVGHGIPRPHRAHHRARAGATTGLGGAHDSRGARLVVRRRAPRSTLEPGGAGKLTWSDGHTADLRIERVEEPSVFGFTWPVYGMPDSDARRTYVEFTLDAGRREHHADPVVETGFAQLEAAEHRQAFESNTGGWASELDELVAYLRV